MIGTFTEEQLQRLDDKELYRLCKQAGVSPGGGKEGYIATLLRIQAKGAQRNQVIPALPPSPRPVDAPWPRPMAVAPAQRAAAVTPPASPRLHPGQPAASPVVGLTPKPTQPIDHLLSVEQAARMLGLGTRTLWNMLAQGTFQRLKPTGRKRTCVSLMEVQAYIARLREPDRQPPLD
jgi:excisionase family DNA binding protein